jgi:AraC family transcriptional regulator
VAVADDQNSRTSRMGMHSFETEPQHCLVYRNYLRDNLPDLYGVAEHWNMPIARHRRDIGRNKRFDGVDHYILTYHVGGAAARRVDDTTSGIARKGAISLQAPMSAATISTDGVVEYTHLYFQQSLLCEVFDEIADANGTAEPNDFFAVLDVPLAGDIEAYVARAMDAEDPATALEMDNRAYLIALGIIRVAQKNRVTIRLRDDLEVRSDLKRMLREIDEHLSETLRLSDLADTMGMSPFHFARIFKEQIGEPPAQYVQRRRTERAIELLRESNLPLSEIAYRTGFSSQSHMNRRVKEMTGLTPRNVRRGK